MRPTIRNFNSSSSISKILKPVIALLRTRGISLIIYLNDLLIAAGVHRLSKLYKTSNFFSGVPGFSNQLRKVCNNPNPKTRILGLHNRYNLYDSCPPSRKNSVDTIISSKTSSNKRYHLNKTAFKIHRPLHFSKTCCFPSTSALPITSVSKKLSFKGSPILPQSVQSECSPEPRSPDRPKVVGKPPAASQQTPIHTNHPDPIITSDASKSGLGSMVWGKICLRPMVSGGNVLAYKPKGTSSCRLGFENILPISKKSLVSHSTSNRQSGSRFIYKPSRGNTLETSLPIKSGPVELVPIKTNPYLRKVYPRYLPQTCRSHVKKVKANCRMEVEPYSVPKDGCSLRDSTNRFVCDKTQHSAQKVCIMDTRLSECRNRQIQCPVVRPTLFCISSLQSDHEMCAKDKKSERENPASNPSMVIQTLVSPPVSSPIRSTPTSSEFRDYATSPIQPEGLEAPTEHKQIDSSHFRKCFSKYQVSERVSKIIFTSWSSGTDSQYKSCWGKWHGWL